MLHVIDQNLQRLSVHRLNLIVARLVQVQHPCKDVVLLHQITSVDGTELVPVERQSRQRREVVFLFNAVIGSLDKVNFLLLALIIDVLQFIDDLLALFVSFAVCKILC